KPPTEAAFSTTPVVGLKPAAQWNLGGAMKFVLKYQVGRLVDTLPDIYTLQPASDYQALISHSTAELTAKAWGRTGAQMRKAIRRFDERNPDVRSKLEQPA